ncbi:hypothetical protein TSOC_008950 [Tetrabaena socialis]|uniref:Uncharacterized protein n=1 Tax=Tetrabaena socialis TaxID=47790 RepID=A0A2J7ZX68_9CHLO|nr:hypothetical protein TSOC_008950 [Tetrabaena socialis]|eukprot:PNH04870.1 hypothetical protein TSOC_008950 [Tetrabaena socialis]
MPSFLSDFRPAESRSQLPVFRPAASFSCEQQDRVLSEVEQQFMAGLRRKDGRTTGLGI